MSNLSDLELMASDSDEASPKSAASLEQVKTKAQRLIELENELSDIAIREKQLKKERAQIRIRDLPEMMFELGLTSIGVGNKVVEIEDMIEGKLPKEPEPLKAACDWLVDNREGGVIKRKLELELPKGDAVMEQRVVDALNAISPKLDPRVVPTVHFKTYEALCKRLVRSGAEIPKDVLGIFVGHIARVKET